MENSDEKAINTDGKKISGKITAKKVIDVAVNVILYAFFALCIVMLVFCLVSRDSSNGAVTLFGKQAYVVISPSMEKCELTDVSEYEIKDIPVNSMVFVELVPEDEEEADEWYAKLKRGDVLTFRYVYASQETITHRIISIEKNETDRGYTIRLAGDNKNDEDGVLVQTINTAQSASPNYVIGKVTKVSLVMGTLVACFRQPAGLVLIIIIPCAIIIVMQVIRIVNALSSDKKKKRDEEREKQQSEIELLKRRLAELEDAAPPKEGAEAAVSSEEAGQSPNEDD